MKSRMTDYLNQWKTMKILKTTMKCLHQTLVNRKKKKNYEFAIRTKN